MLVELGRLPGDRGSSSNCTGVDTSSNGSPSRLDLLQVTVGDAPAGRRRPRGCPAPATTGPRMPTSFSFHSSSVCSTIRPATSAAPTAAFSIALERVEARVVDELVEPEALGRRPASSGSPAASRSRRTGRRTCGSCRRAGCPARVRTSAGTLPAPRRAAATRDAAAHRPHGRREQRHVDDVRLAGALAVQQRGRDAAGDGHGADRVAVGGPGLVEQLWRGRTASRVARRRHGPRSRGVVAAGVGVGARGCRSPSRARRRCSGCGRGCRRRRSSASRGRPASCW